MARPSLAAWRWAWLLLPCLFVLPARAAPQEGFDYEVRSLPGQRVAPDRVEVIEFFWYQCPHCKVLESLLVPWAQALRERIRLVRVPMALRRDSARQVEMYYALEALGEIERLHPLIFQAIHEDTLPLKTLAQMADFAVEQGIPRRRFVAAMRSAAVARRAAEARRLVDLHRVREVPTLIVDRRFVTSAGHVGGTQADAMAVVEWLLGRAENERRAGVRSPPN